MDSPITARPVKDRQTVTPDGQDVHPRIDGVVIRRAPPVEDKRGEIVEVYNPAWGLHPQPLVYVYQSTLRPGAIKGWIVHEKQDDRLFMVSGFMRWALFDNRPESATYKLLNVFTFSERNRALLVIPQGVFHGVQNIGATEAIFINMPTRPYNHADPDKLRLPIKNDLIPFDFDDGPGW
ncbi:MAG: dTDP-4-dehydrorhamnose 3,5-epimerase [Chloroflexi bacterium]|nr:dTDP-4-dehydrorhamnose 3,5-epimerase [Chloroflexota bacterium]